LKPEEEINDLTSYFWPTSLCTYGND